jgi:hypothetical protein
MREETAESTKALQLYGLVPPAENTAFIAGLERVRPATAVNIAFSSVPGHRNDGPFFATCLNSSRNQINRNVNRKTCLLIFL